MACSAMGGWVLYQWHTLESSTHGQKVLWSCVSSLCFEGRNVCMYSMVCPRALKYTELLSHFKQPHWPYQNMYLVTWWASLYWGYVHRQIHSEQSHLCSALILFSHCWKVDKTKPLSYHFSNSSEQLWSTHPSLCSTNDMQPGFLFQKKIIKMGGFSPDFFLKPNLN
jgi:hypothetical protein